MPNTSEEADLDPELRKIGNNGSNYHPTHHAGASFVKTPENFPLVSDDDQFVNSNIQLPRR